MKNFVLQFEKKGAAKHWLLAIPQSNHYQKISRLSLPENTTQLNSAHQDLLAIFDVKEKTQVKFRHQGLEQNFDWQNLNFKQKAQGPYFNHDQYINGADKKIIELAKNWLGAETDPKKIVRLLYEESLAYLSYGNPIRDLHPYSQALTEKVTDCGGFATFLASLLQSQGLAARLVVGYLLKNRLREKLCLKHGWHNLSMHAWLEVQLSDAQWLPLDPAVDWRYRHGQSQRRVSLERIPADRLVLSFAHLPTLTWQNKNYQWPILQHPEIIEKNNV